MRTIELPEELAFDVLELIDERADALRDLAIDSRQHCAGGKLGGEYDALAAAWEEDARTIRRAPGIEIDGED